MIKIIKKNVVLLSFGNIFSQLFVFLSMIFVTKHFSPEAFGKLGLFTSISTIFISIICLRYEQAIMLPNNKHEIDDILNLVISIIIIFSLASFAFLYLFFEVYEKNRFSLLEIIVLVVYSATGGILISFQRYFSKFDQFKEITFFNSFDKIFSQIFMVFSSLMNFIDASFLIGSKFWGRIIAVGYILKKSNYRYRLNIKKNIFLAKKYFQYPKYNLWAALVATLLFNFPVLFIDFFYSSNITGHFNLSRMVLNMPMVLIGQSISTVFYRNAVDKQNIENLDRLVIKTFKEIVSVFIVPFIWLSFNAFNFFVFLLGEEWRICSYFIQIQSVASLSTILATPFLPVFNVKNKLRLNLYWNLFSFVLIVLSFCISSYFYKDYNIAVKFYSISIVISNIVLLFLIGKITKIKFSLWKKKILHLISLIGIVFCIFLFKEYFIVNTVLCILFFVIQLMRLIKGKKT